MDDDEVIGFGEDGDMTLSEHVELVGNDEDWARHVIHAAHKLVELVMRLDEAEVPPPVQFEAFRHAHLLVVMAVAGERVSNQAMREALELYNDEHRN